MSERQSMDTAVQPVGMYAVFRHTRAIKRAKFAMLHYTPDSAQREAERLTALSIEEHGPDSDTVYYVAKIVGRAGLIDGRLISEKL